MRRPGCALVLAIVACGGQGGGGSSPRTANDTDQMQPALAAAVDSNGRLWMAAGYTDESSSGGSSMGLSIRSPDGAWWQYEPLVPDSGVFRPSGDGWLAAAQQGSRAYYLSLLQTHGQAPAADELGDGLALAVIDFGAGVPKIIAPRRIDPGDRPSWDEPTIAATRRPGDATDTLLVAATPIGPDLQDEVAVLVSRDGGGSFSGSTIIHAPGYPGHHPPRDTLVRPVLQQDPRAGFECHSWLAFGVYYPSALASTSGIQPPSCVSDPSGCRSLAETETVDCGRTWAPPTFIAVDTGSPQGEDFRGFAYAVAGDGTRLVMFGDEDAAGAPILLKRAAPGASFTVVQGGRWDDGPMETVARGTGASGQAVRRWRPTLAASARVAAFWVEEDTSSHESTLWVSDSATTTASWMAPRRVNGAGIACDTSTFPEDDYMSASPDGALGVPTGSFVVAWAPFAPCGSNAPRHVEFAVLH